VREVAACEVRVSPDTTLIAAFHVGGSEADLRAQAEAQLARYKQPRLYVARETLPRTPNGKLNRRALRESLQASAPAHTRGLANPRPVNDEGA
jgi:acyl-CoA synthetase (AMP-forming)/AMP-acid ligase II